ncbi:MAG TPA: PIN domain-containing protein [Bryobacteraceae bacterium]|nr:PIN domain-containing protein [Bryobacteraceae bacterium]
MKLLVDTSVWSLALRRRDAACLSPDEQKLKAELTQAIQDGRVAMIGLIRQELLSGIKEQAQFAKIKSALAPFVDERIDTADHEHAARLYNECGSQGFEVGPVDMLICAVAMRRNWQVLSNDSGLNHCLGVAKTFQENEGRAADEGDRKSRRGFRKLARRSRNTSPAKQPDACYSPCQRRARYFAW